MGDKVKTRDQTDPKYKWNIEAMYANKQKWQKDYTKAMELSEAFTGYSGKLGKSADILFSALSERDELWKTVERVYVYARMKKDEDTGLSEYQAMCDKAKSLIAGVSSQTSFFTPELLGLPEKWLLDCVRNDARFSIYEHSIKDMLRLKPHVLSHAEEALIAQFGELASVTNDVFSMINNADMKFGKVTDERGQSVELTHGRYIGLMESANRDVRKEVFKCMYKAYEERKNTLATNYNYNTKTDIINARIRRYPSSLDAALSGDNVPLNVYKNLIEAVNKRLSLIHRYVEIRKRALKLDRVHMYDLYTSLVLIPDERISYEEALAIMEDALAPLGEDYIRDMKKGISAGWIDVFENRGKTSGAYSYGSYDSMPYILLNYNYRLKDVFTIVHEMGHSMHSFYSRREQPFIYGGHSIFTAEVASTVNENLLLHSLLERERDPARRKYLLNLHIEEFRGTLFRQTMFAEFEMMTHEAAEKGEVLTQEWLCEHYLELNRKYFGPAIVYDPLIAFEWARIPHFYNAFYVYKYATGYSAAVALSDGILKGGEEKRDAYLSFLGSGESDYPINLLKKAGVDMGSPDPIDRALNSFEKLIDEMDQMIV